MTKNFDSFYHILKDLSADVRICLYDAIHSYTEHGVVAEFDEVSTKVIFMLIKEQIDESVQKHKSNVENGKKGGNPNFKKGQRNPYYSDDKAPQVEEKKPATPTKRYSKKPTKKTANIDILAYDDVIDEKESSQQMADTFFEAYPKKEDKGRVEDWFRSNQPSEELFKKILSAIIEQQSSWQWTNNNGKYIPKPANWLRAKSWENVQVTAPKPTMSQYAQENISGLNEMYGTNFSSLNDITNFLFERDVLGCC